MYCKYCGKQIDDDSVFCNFCGENQYSLQEDVKRTKSRKTNIADFLASFFKEVFILASIIIGYILLLAGICYVFNINEGRDFWVAIVLPPTIIIIGRYAFLLSKWIKKNKSKSQ